MPRNTPSRPEAPNDDPPEHATEEEIEAARLAFVAGFSPTRTGGLTQTINGVRLVIFNRGGSWRWCMDPGTDLDNPSPRYSALSFDEDVDAVADLWCTWIGGCE